MTKREEREVDIMDVSAGRVDNGLLPTAAKKSGRLYSLFFNILIYIKNYLFQCEEAR
jgi:hypothetical protein